MNIEKRTFSIEKSDWIDFQIFHAKQSGIFKQRVFQSRMNTFFFGAILFAYSPALIKDTNFLFVFWIFIAIAFFVYNIRVKSSTEFGIAKNSELLISNETKSGIFSDQHLVFADGIIEISDHRMTTRLNCGHLVKVIENSKCLYLYTSSVNAIILPHTLFSSGAEKKEFIELLEESMKKNQLTS